MIDTEYYLLGRQANLKGEGIDSNPFEVNTPEHRDWHDGFLVEEEDTRSLSIHFSARNELAEEVKEQNRIIETLQSTLMKKKRQLRVCNEKLDSMKEFLIELRDMPPRWAKSYRKQVYNFCDDMGL